jgi:acyl-CoA thioesterase-1
MLRVLVSMLALLLSGTGVGAEALGASPVLILGDSLSAGYGISQEASWPNLLRQRLLDEGYRHSVVNASISGETTSGGARRIAALLEQHQAAVVVLALGANDGLRGVDVAETRKNLSIIIGLAKAADATVVLLKVRIPPNYGPQYTAAFERIFDELGELQGVIYAPFMLEQFALDARAFQNDGLHPKADVQPRILDTLWPSIAQALDGKVMEALFN